MSFPHLPPELLDHIVDFLHDSSDTLKNCSLASKAWIPRARKRLFADVKFQTPKDLESWEVMFSDPCNSPACYAKTLFIGSPHIVEASRIGVGCWLSTFSHVVHLGMEINGGDIREGMTVSLIQFHGFSPVLKSLHVISSAFSRSKISNLVCSFPLLEDVTVQTMFRNDVDYGFSEQPTITKPSNSPVFTGSLRLSLHNGMKPIASRLLSLPGGLRFRRLWLEYYYEADVLAATALVEGCCSTLESLKIDNALDLSQSAHVNLNGATKLMDVGFTWWRLPGWVIKTLRTVTHNHRELKQITLEMSSGAGITGYEHDIGRAVGENTYQEWLELDRLLVQLCELHPIRLKVLYHPYKGTNENRERRRMKILLPEMMTRRMVDLVGHHR